MKYLSLLLISAGFLFTGCEPQTQQSDETSKPDTLSFTSHTVADSVTFLWANSPADITGDRIADLVFTDNNAYGGTLGYYKGDTSQFPWHRVNIAEQAPGGGKFASGDLECADADGDGDVDIFAVEHKGEWGASSEPARLYLFENPDWQPHFIGEIPSFIKDLTVADFNQDGKMDVAAITYAGNTVSIYQQESLESWERVLFFSDYQNVHEGMAAGDVDGDGFPDLIANGYVFFNPQGNLARDWPTQNMDSIWNNQDGDWSKNASKIQATDMDGDGKAEVFISHSERRGYPLAFYQYLEGSWTKNIITDSIPAAHTLQIADFNQDGIKDVLTGINKSRASGLDIDTYTVSIYLASEGLQNWTPYLLTEDGIYNGAAIDFDQDGDVDVFRYPTHDATTLYLMENQIVQ